MPIENQITIIEAQEWLDKQKTAFFFDVRTHHRPVYAALEKFEHMPMQELSKQIENLDENKTIILLCQDGSHSTKAQNFLSACGYKKSFIVRGGIDDWAKVYALQPTQQ